MKSGCIFDWDGVIIDSSRQHEKSWELLAQEVGKPLPEDHFVRGFGRKNEVIIPDILGWTSDLDEIARLGARKEELYRQAVEDDGLEALPGVHHFLRALAEAGIPRSVGSSTSRLNIDTILPIVGLEGCFEAITSAEDVTVGKPDPAVFLLAAERVGATPAVSVVFEDAMAGLEAARRGGFRSIAVATTHRPSELEGKADRIIERMEELDVDAIRTLCESPA